MVIGPRPRIWCSAGTGLRSQGAPRPRRRRRPAEALALGVLEVERRAAVALGDRRCCTPSSSRRRATSRGVASPATRRPVRAIACVPRRSRRDRPVEEGQVGAGRRHAVGVEQVVGADVVLVDGLLHQPHAQRVGVEGGLPGASAVTAVRWWMPPSSRVIGVSSGQGVVAAISGRDGRRKRPPGKRCFAGLVPLRGAAGLPATAYRMRYENIPLITRDDLPHFALGKVD